MRSIKHPIPQWILTVNAAELIERFEACSVELIIGAECYPKKVRVRFDLVGLHVAAMPRYFSIYSFEVGKLDVVGRGVRRARRHSLNVEVGKLKKMSFEI